MNSYHNSTNENGALLEVYQDKALSQDEKVLAFFKSQPGKFFTPFDVHKKVFGDNVPYTSTRRAITNLTNRGLLYKSNTKEIEQYGRSNFTWCLLEIDVKGQTKVF